MKGGPGGGGAFGWRPGGSGGAFGNRDGGSGDVGGGPSGGGGAHWTQAGARRVTVPR